MRLFLFALIFLMILFLLKIPQKLRTFFKHFLQPASAHSKQNKHQAEVLDEMKACKLCGTYVPSQMAFYFEKQIFCSQQCLVKAKNKR